MKTCIIITATIDPKGMVFTKRNSPEDRLNDYKKVFKEFCNQQEVSNIIFIENSGYSLDYFQNEKKKYKSVTTKKLRTRYEISLCNAILKKNLPLLEIFEGKQ